MGPISANEAERPLGRSIVDRHTCASARARIFPKHVAPGACLRIHCLSRPALAHQRATRPARGQHSIVPSGGIATSPGRGVRIDLGPLYLVERREHVALGEDADQSAVLHDG